MKGPETTRSYPKRNLFCLYEGPKDHHLFYLYERPRDYQKPPEDGFVLPI